MTPVDQLVLYQDEPRIWGDCQRACIASLLDLPALEVPHFLELANGVAFDNYDMIEDFLAPRGLVVLWQRSLAYHWQPGEPDCYHLLSGPSPRFNTGHMVVGLNGKVFHDPHPSRAGLAGNPANWSCSFIVKANTHRDLS